MLLPRSFLLLMGSDRCIALVHEQTIKTDQLFRSRPSGFRVPAVRSPGRRNGETQSLPNPLDSAEFGAWTRGHPVCHLAEARFNRISQPKERDICVVFCLLHNFLPSSLVSLTMAASPQISLHFQAPPCEHTGAQACGTLLMGGLADGASSIERPPSSKQVDSRLLFRSEPRASGGRCEIQGVLCQACL